MSAAIRTLLERIFCRHDWRLAGIGFDGEMACVCAKCGKTKRVPL